MYADKMTAAIQNTVAITQSRRKLQHDYNIEHNIVPKTISRSIVEFMPQEGGEQEEVSYSKSKKGTKAKKAQSPLTNI